MMNRIKKHTLLFAVSAAFLCACTDREEVARMAAESFLMSYYSLDYQTAESFCTPEMAERIDEAVKDVDALPEYIREKMKEASRETSYEIVAIDAASVKGEAAVSYRLFASGAGKPLEKTLRLKVERDSALIYAIE